MIDHEAPEPVWQQIADVIRLRITSGEYPRRRALPGITRLASEFDVAPMTIRKALDALKSEGLLIATSGKGTFVV